MASELPALKVLLVRGNSIFSHGKTQVITETAGYFWSRSFCKVSVEVAHASRGRRDCRGPRKEELEESTSQFPLLLENMKEVHSLHCGSTYRSVE